MTWDAEGNRIGLTSSTGDQYVFVYDPTASIPAVLAEIRPGSGLEPISYVREPNGALISRGDWNTFEDHYYFFDELGSTRLIVNEQGNVTDRYTYDAWGNVTAHDQYAGSIGNSQPYRYVGKLGYYTHHQDPNMDLLQLGVRFYDPETGRFTQTDPAKDGINLYAYAHGQPTRYIDPSGLGVLDPDWPAWEECVKKCNDTMGIIEPSDACALALGAGKTAIDCYRDYLKYYVVTAPWWLRASEWTLKYVVLPIETWDLMTNSNCRTVCSFEWYRDFWSDYDDGWFWRFNWL